MRAAPPLLSLLLILLYHAGWSYGLCKLENSMATCHKLEDIEYIDTSQLELLKVPVMQDVLTPGLFSDFDNLRHLDLSGGHLKKIERGCFQNLSELRSLNLGDNRIEYLELASLEGLAQLRSLNLRRNVIRQLPPALVRLKNLRHLDIHGNPLECNCATLKVRDLIAQRGVTVSKKVVCAGPNNMKGTALMKPNAAIVCSLEKQDREMQNDQPEGSGMDSGSGDATDAWDDIFKEEDETDEKEEEADMGEEEEDDEYIQVHNSSSEKDKEVETSSAAASPDFSTKSPAVESINSSKELFEVLEENTSTTTSSLLATTEDEEIFFDSEEKKEQSTTTEMSRKKEVIKDSLFYPVSGDSYEASGEGSGDGYDEERNNAEDDSNESSLIWNVVTGIAGFLGATASPPVTKDPDLEGEQFIDVSTKATTEEPIVPITSHTVGAEIEMSTVATSSIATSSIANGVEVIKSATGDDSKSGNVKAEVDSLNDELAEVSTSKQSKKGMGSYVVLAILLAVLAALIGFAAYKGDFCRKKRKRSDVENGTELKDMQKSLLPDTGNSTQPKIAPNGHAENVPLVEGAPDQDAKLDRIRNDDHQNHEAPRSPNGTVDHPEPVKPPRKQISPQDNQTVEDRPRVDVNSLKENFFADRSSPMQTSPSPTATHVSESNGPPLSPGAQRVKITLQEIPDSVPKTPILITRTMAGENLVKTP